MTWAVILIITGWVATMWVRDHANPCFLRTHSWSEECFWTKTHHMGIDKDANELVSFSIRYKHCNRCNKASAVDIVPRRLE